MWEKSKRTHHLPELTSTGAGPLRLQEIEYKQQIQKQGGLSVPLNICLFQEVQRLQIVIERIRSDLENLRLAIKGEVVMTPALQSALDAMYDAKLAHVVINTVLNLL